MIRDAKIDGMVSWFSFLVRRVYSIVKPATQMPLRNLSQPLQRDQLWACGCKWVEFWIFWSILWYLHVQSCPGQFQHVKTRKPFHKTRYVKCTKVHFVTVGLLDLLPFASFCVVLLLKRLLMLALSWTVFAQSFCLTLEALSISSTLLLLWNLRGTLTGLVNVSWLCTSHSKLQVYQGLSHVNFKILQSFFSKQVKQVPRRLLWCA